MKTNKIFWGLVLILVAVFLIMDALGVSIPLPEAAGEISTFKLILGGGLAVFAIASLIRLEFAGFFFSIALIFVLLEKNIALLYGRAEGDLINNWILFPIAALLTAGCYLVFPKRKRQQSFAHVKIDSDSESNSLGNTVVYVDSATMKPAYIENNLGSCNVYFENPESYSGNGVLHIENNLGSMVVHVPETWDVHVSVENNLGSVTTPDEVHDEALILTIEAENNLGSMTVKYVKA